ncbi:MAPEG family protein [Candidatus Electrothrix sp.]|uniref:MAPEG family protein n=1 Tax=Candidatus Electrothrix sp. TaxID=2170559 RepID=UPI0040578E8F
MSTKDTSSLGPDGMPLLDESEIRQGKIFGWRNFLGGFFTPLALGLPIAFLIFSLGDTAYYRQNISAMFPVSGQWVLLTAFVFSRLSAFLNLFPLLEKEKVMHPDSGNLRANMKIFKVLGNGTSGAVVMNMEGQTGRYNRANRSMENFVENAAPIGVNAVLVSLCFPLPAFILICIYALARVAHQVLYINVGYGSLGYGTAFLLGTTITGVFEGLLLFAAFST